MFRVFLRKPFRLPLVFCFKQSKNQSELGKHWKQRNF